MTTTPISRSALGRARTERLEFVSTLAFHRCATAHTAASPATAVPVDGAAPTAMNTWLGGGEQGLGSDSKYAVKRISPGCLEGMT